LEEMGSWRPFSIENELKRPIRRAENKFEKE
jgi:hypothetical protein